MKRVYVCSPLRGNGTIADSEKNLVLAKKLCLAVVNAGYAPYSPHVFFVSIGLDDRDPKHRAAALAAGVVWLRMADEIWVFARNLDECSEGMLAEVVKAAKFNIPVKAVFMPNCWAEFESELSKRAPKVVEPKPALRGANVPAGLNE